MAVPQPDPFRSRLAGVLAEAIARLDADAVPAPLKRVAAFAPAKRARLGGRQIVETADADAVLRAALAADLRERSDADPAVLAWLDRGDGWEEVVRAATEAGQEREAQERARVAEAEVERAGEREAAAVAELREVRRRAKDDLAAARAENADLRRKQGEARQQARRAGEEAEGARRSAEESTTTAARQWGSHEAEVRRLQKRVEELEQRLARKQGEGRTERERAGLRTRVLLDSVVDAAVALRRDLGLPATTGDLADAVEADLPGATHRASSGAGSMAPDDPTLLVELCGVPHVHVLVDGYNVSKTARPEAPLESQRQWLVQGAAGLVARTGAQVTVVFDAADLAGPRPPVAQPRGVRVRFSRPGQIADDLIRDFVDAEPDGRPVVVVTSDRAVVSDVVRRPGTHAVPSAALARLIDR